MGLGSTETFRHSKMRSSIVELGAESKSRMSFKKSDTQRKTPCEDRHTGKKAMWQRGGDWSQQNKAWDPWPPSEAGRGKGGLPLEPSKRGARPCWHIDFRLLAPRTVKEAISVVFKLPSLRYCSDSDSKVPGQQVFLLTENAYSWWLSKGSLHNHWISLKTSLE